MTMFVTYCKIANLRPCKQVDDTFNFFKRANSVLWTGCICMVESKQHCPVTPYSLPLIQKLAERTSWTSTINAWCTTNNQSLGTYFYNYVLWWPVIIVLVIELPYSSMHNTNNTPRDYRFVRENRRGHVSRHLAYFKLGYKLKTYACTMVVWQLMLL